MLRLQNLRNKWQKRTLRPAYAHTQAYPYAAVLDPTLRDSDGSFRRPVDADAPGGGFPLDRTDDAFVYKNGLLPGTVLVKSAAGEAVAVHNGADDVEPFGLLANFVGGELDELGDEDEVGVWRGFDGVLEVLAPAFDDTGLSAAYSSATAGVPVELQAGADGRLVLATSGVVVAKLIERVSASRILIDLKI